MGKKNPVTSQQGGPGLTSASWGLSSPHVCVGFLQILQVPPNPKTCMLGEMKTLNYL